MDGNALSLAEGIGFFIRNYKCFGERWAGFDTIRPINILVGKNNSGKTSMLEALPALIGGANSLPAELGHKGLQPEVLVRRPLTHDEHSKAFKNTASGGPIRGNHEAYGRGKRTTRWSLLSRRGQRPELVNGERNLEDIAVEFRAEVARLVQSAVNEHSPFLRLRYLRLGPDRNIQPEDHSRNIGLAANGDGATTTIRRFVLNQDLDEALVESTLLDDLNRIVEPHWKFTGIRPQQNEDQWEIYLEEHGKPRVALSHTGSGLKTIILVLIQVLLMPVVLRAPLGSLIFAMEELENNLHPTLLRRLLDYVEATASKYGCTFFLSTHSNVAIDALAGSPSVQVVHVSHDGDEATTVTASNFRSTAAILDDLGCRPSDLLQTNSVVWVEGPSDRIYLNAWIRSRSQGQLREGMHYQCMFYGGRLLAHLTAQDPGAEIDQLINLIRINTKCIVIIDSDIGSSSETINATKERVVKEVTELGGLAWVTAGREIENYAIQSELSSATGLADLSCGDFDPVWDVLDAASAGKGKHWRRQKIELAKRVSTAMVESEISPRLDLLDRIDEVCAKIRFWNGLT